ncbi:MAG: FAD:protein FMN transferase [Candidatus Schekmanbacteria bacterium]|nr:FAD:protein FMN transferase [Candidatus Schekmanbacteria bacterium]
MFAIILSSCSSLKFHEGSNDSLYVYRDFVMGVQVELTLRSSDENTAQNAAMEAFEEMKRLDRMLSNWKDDSEVSEINRNSSTEWIKVSDEMFEVLSRAQSLSKETNGAFDITVGKLLHLWNFYSRNPLEPSEKEQRNAMGYVSYKFIELDRVKKMLRFIKPGIEIDLGGIAKGYILEKGYEVLEDNGIQAGLINGSGDVYVWGEKPDGNLWNVAVRNPGNPETPLAILPLTDMAVFSSGDYERKFSNEGKTFHHIFDPRTGMPATGCHGVTVIAKTIKDADGLSSSVFVMGPEEGKDFADKIGGTGVIIIENDGRVVFNKWVRKRFSGVQIE